MAKKKKNREVRGQTKENVKQSVSWLNYIDYFFEGIDDYIREKVS